MNGTEVDESKEYMDINEEFVVRGLIPDAIFSGMSNSSLGAVEIHWSMQVWDDDDGNGDPGSFMGMPLVEANLNLIYYTVHPSEIWDWYYLPPGEDIIYEEGWEWEMHSWQQNNTMGDGFAGTLDTEDTDEGEMYEYQELPARLKIIFAFLHLYFAMVYY